MSGEAGPVAEHPRVHTNETDWEEAAERARLLVNEAVEFESDSLDEAASKSLLAAYGIPVPAGALVNNEAEAEAAARRLGGRLAIKAVGAEITHKTERGLVILGVEGPEAAATAVATLRERAGEDFSGALLERMIDGQREFLVGMKRDPVFGPVVAFGLGGVLTEALEDVALAVTPLSDQDAAALPTGIRASRLLGPFRGAAPVDLQALHHVISAVAHLAEQFPEIAEIDINPLLIEEGRPVAADALVILDPHPAGTAPGRAFVPDLRAVFAPESVAIVGASDDVRKWGGSALRNLLDGGYEGTIYPVNPRGGVYFDVQGYPSLADLPEAPDLVLLAVGGAQVKGVVEESGRRGAKAAVVLAAGFSETGEEGAQEEREIARVAREHGLTIIGPNCMGLMSNESHLHATGFAAMHPPAGRLSFVSQSGSMGPTVINTCERRGIGVDKFLSVGNEAQVSAFDVLDHLRTDENTDCIMMYLEGIDDGRHFLEAAQRTTAAKPVVVLRGGLTDSGRKAAASHTGALAGSAAVFRAAARQSGVILADTTSELVDLGACLTYLPAPSGPRVAVITNGGGPGVLGTDAVVDNGLVMADLPEELIAGLDKLLPPFWSRGNPLDLVAAGFGETGLKAIDMVTRCDEVDAVLALNFLGVPSAGTSGENRPRLANGEYDGFSDWEREYLERVSHLMDETGKPIVNVPDHPIHGVHVPVAGGHIPLVLSSPSGAARALAVMARYGEYLVRQKGVSVAW